MSLSFDALIWHRCFIYTFHSRAHEVKAETSQLVCLTSAISRYVLFFVRASRWRGGGSECWHVPHWYDGGSRLSAGLQTEATQSVSTLGVLLVVTSRTLGSVRSAKTWAAHFLLFNLKLHYGSFEWVSVWEFKTQLCIWMIFKLNHLGFFSLRDLWRCWTPVGHVSASFPCSEFHVECTSSHTEWSRDRHRGEILI